MPAQHQDEYCHVDKKGNILEGPMVLPSKWGSIAGFNHLKGKDLLKHRWFRVLDDGYVGEGEPFSLVYLPEQTVVLKVPSRSNTDQGRRQYAIARLYSVFRAHAAQPFLFATRNGVFSFPNTALERAQMQACWQLSRNYICMAQRLNGNFERVEVEHKELEGFIQGSVDAHNALANKTFAGMDDINSSTDEQIVALLDTNMSDYYG